MSEVETGAAAPVANVVEQPAATPETVATPAGDTPAPQEVQTAAESKSFSQDELNALIQKEKAKAEAKAERRALRAYRETLERLIPNKQSTEAPEPGRPSRAQFANDEDYVEAVADWKIAQREKATQQEKQQEQQRSLASKTEKLYAQAEKEDGFDRDAFDSLPLTSAIAAAVTDSDIAPKLMAYMAANPDEVARIADLPPHRQAAAIGRMEERIANAPPPPKASKAPPPIAPVGTNKATAQKDPADMTQREFEKWRKEQIALRGR